MNILKNVFLPNRYLKKLSTAASSPSSVPRSCRVPRRKTTEKLANSVRGNLFNFFYCSCLQKPISFVGVKKKDFRMYVTPTQQ